MKPLLLHTIPPQQLVSICKHMSAVVNRSMLCSANQYEDIGILYEWISGRYDR